MNVKQMLLEHCFDIAQRSAKSQYYRTWVIGQKKSTLEAP